MSVPGSCKFRSTWRLFKGPIIGIKLRKQSASGHFSPGRILSFILNLYAKRQGLGFLAFEKDHGLGFKVPGNEEIDAFAQKVGRLIKELPKSEGSLEYKIGLSNIQTVSEPSYSTFFCLSLLLSIRAT